MNKNSNRDLKLATLSSKGFNKPTGNASSRKHSVKHGYNQCIDIYSNLASLYDYKQKIFLNNNNNNIINYDDNDFSLIQKKIFSGKKMSSGNPLAFNNTNTKINLSNLKVNLAKNFDSSNTNFISK